VGVKKVKPVRKSSKASRRHVSAGPGRNSPNVRQLKQLLAEAAEARAHQTATAEILKVIASSPSDVQPVFDAITQSAAHLFAPCIAGILMREGDRVALHGLAGPAHVNSDAMAKTFPVAFDPQTSAVSQAIATCHVTQILDSEAADAPAAVRAAGRAIGFRSLTVAPLVREDVGVGAIAIASPNIGYRLSDKQLSLLRSFSDQAVIAIENVRLFNETREALERQTATAEILQVINSSPNDLRPVLTAVAERAAHICDAYHAAIILVVESNQLRIGTQYLQTSNTLATANTSEIFPLDRDTVMGRAVMDRAAVQVNDLQNPPDGDFDRGRQLALRLGHRTTLAVPLLRGNQALGAILLRRREVRPFSAKQIALLGTFADQAAIAIENARLFHELQEKNAQIEAVSRHKSEFLANMSHELRTPLNAILGFSEVLGERYFGELNEKQDEYVRDIRGSGEHLLSLINDILDLSKVEAGKMELELSEFDLPAAVKNVVALVKERAQRHGITVSVDLASGLSAIRADERKLKQIMLNLLSNAVKFTPDGGAITVVAKQVGQMVEIAVADTGAGIAPGDLPTVFEEFKQVGSDSARKAEGTGLGLPLAKKFAELHGGEIKAESEPGAGSTFIVVLPLS